MTIRPERSANPHTEELTARISWIIRLRWVAAAGVGATTWLVPRLWSVDLPAASLYLVTFGLAVYNAGLWSIKRWLPAVTRGLGLMLFANLQISIDLLFLTALLHLSGGVENPFVCYYVFHVVIASILLSRRATYLQVGLALALFCGLAIAEYGGILPHYHLTGYLGHELYRNPIYVTGAAVTVGTLLFFAAFMATSITARLREREAEILGLSSSLEERASELQQALDALQRLEKEKSRYMQHAAHNLRSPMAAVELSLAVVAEGRAGEISGKGSTMLQRARVRIGEVLDLASDLVALSRARETALAVDSERVDLAHIVQNSEAEFRQSAEAASIRFVTRCSPSPVEVLGDPGALTELLRNLVSNALKYTPAGGEVRVELEEGEDGVVISVADSGIGIEAEETDRIFEEFYRAKSARESGKEGTGLGLSIVKAIAESHGGAVWVDSEPGRGTTFRVSLPTARSAVVSQART
jgi:signal transduction histidine kinase